MTKIIGFFPNTYVHIDGVGRTLISESPLTLDEKIKNYLNEEDYLLYKQAETLNNQLWQTYVDQGLQTNEILYENIFIPEFNENFDIEIGYRTVLAPGIHPSQLAIHPSYAEWLSRLPVDLFGTTT